MIVQLAHHLIGLLQSFLVILFIGLFATRKEHHIARIFVAIFLQASLTFLANQFSSPWLNIFSYIISSFLASLIVFNCPIKMRIMSSIVASILFAICEIITMLTISALLQGNMNIVTALTIPNLAVTLSSCVLYQTVYWVIRMVLKKRNKQMASFLFSADSNFVLLLIISLFVAYYTILVDREIPENSYLIPWGFCLFLALLAVDVYLLLGSESVRKRNQLERELSAMRQQEGYLAEMVRMHEDSIDDMRAQAHDFRRHLELIEKLMGSQQIGEAESALKQYMTDVQADLTQKTKFGCVKNPALRLILDRAAQKCEANGIDLEANVRYSDFDFMPYQDICILLDNAIENAIDACQRICSNDIPKWVSIAINRQKGVVLIKIANSKTNAILTADDNLVSSKPHPREHGIGLRNIKRIAQKHNGHVVVHYEEMEFALIISISPQTPNEAFVK